MTHEIDYKIIGNEMQAIEIELDPDEVVIAEAGAMMYMDDQIEMQTILGDGVQDNGFFGKLWSAGKRVLTGESLFMTAFKHIGYSGKSHVTFSSPYPGKIVPLDLNQLGEKIICQKDAFLCAAKGVTVGIEFQKKLGTGFFGGEGFIMQKIEGNGWAFLHAGGSIIEKKLDGSQTFRVDTGCIVGFTSGINYNVKFVGGIKNTLFGGEGLFFVELSGNGTVWLQTLPFSRLADRIISHAPSKGGKRRGEGSILGGLGDLLDGDN